MSFNKILLKLFLFETLNCWSKVLKLNFSKHYSEKLFLLLILKFLNKINNKIYYRYFIFIFNF